MDLKCAGGLWLVPTIPEMDPNCFLNALGDFPDNNKNLTKQRSCWVGPSPSLGNLVLVFVLHKVVLPLKANVHSLGSYLIHTAFRCATVAKSPHYLHS